MAPCPHCTPACPTRVPCFCDCHKATRDAKAAKDREAKKQAIVQILLENEGNLSDGYCYYISYPTRDHRNQEQRRQDTDAAYEKGGAIYSELERIAELILNAAK